MTDPDEDQRTDVLNAVRLLSDGFAFVELLLMEPTYHRIENPRGNLDQYEVLAFTLHDGSVVKIRSDDHEGYCSAFMCA